MGSPLESIRPTGTARGTRHGRTAAGSGCVCLFRHASVKCPGDGPGPRRTGAKLDDGGKEKRRPGRPCSVTDEQVRYEAAPRGSVPLGDRACCHPTQSILDCQWESGVRGLRGDPRLLGPEALKAHLVVHLEDPRAAPGVRRVSPDRRGRSRQYLRRGPRATKEGARDHQAAFTAYSPPASSSARLFFLSRWPSASPETPAAAHW